MVRSAASFRFVVPALAVGVVAVAAACGGGEEAGEAGTESGLATEPEPGSFGTGSNAGLTLDPKNTTVVIDTATVPPTRGSATFRVVRKTAGGERDVTGASTFTLDDPTLGAFTGETFTSTDSLPASVRGRSTRVVASSAAGSAQGTLTVVALRKTGPQRDFFFVVPYREAPSPSRDVLAFSTKLTKVDVAFAMDTTASMGGSINNLKSALQGTLLANLQAAIPDVGLAIVDYKDYPVSPHGNGGDFPVLVRQSVTTDLAAAQSAVAQYGASGGGDGPESQIPAMQHILTGEALAWRGGQTPASAPPAPRWGGVAFRPGSVPVLVNITDVAWQSGYGFAAPTMASLKNAFASRNAFFVDVTSGDESQADELSDATGSSVAPSAFGGACGGQCCTGTNGGGRPPTAPGGRCRLNFRHANGTGVSSSIVKAIEAISVGAVYDVKAVPSNAPANPGGIDATKFIKALRAMDEGAAASGCPATPARDSDGDGIKDTFVAVKVGTPVCFEIVAATNESALPLETAQFLNAFVDVVGVQGNVQLDRRSVLFLVPPKDPAVK